jgi:hypothetical protein
MTWHNKVVWTEGMFLQPQHFQQHDRFTEYQLRQRLAATLGHAWGFTSVAIDDAALALGKLSINSAQGVLPDGTAFSIPATTPLRRRSTSPPTRATSASFSRSSCSGPASSSPTPSRPPARWGRATRSPRSTSATATPTSIATPRSRSVASTCA